MIKKKDLFYYLFLCVYVHMNAVPVEARRCVGFPGAEVPGSYDLLGVGTWELNSGTLK